MNQISIVFKIILPLFFGLFLIAAVSIFSNFYLLEKNISNKAHDTFSIVSSSLSNIMEQDTQLMLGLIEQLEKDQKTINYYKNNDRESLYTYLVNTYESYNKRYDITHFYIHKINKQNFLRVHNPKKHSDFIDRVTLSKSLESLQMSSGVEFGIAHNLTLRVVLPWFVEGELIGFLELGKEIDKLTPKLSKSVNVDIVFTINKELISADNFDKWKNNNRNRHYELMEFHYIIDSTIEIIDKSLQIHLDEVTPQKDHEHEYVENQTQRYFIHTSPFFDINKKKVGSIHILIEVSQDYAFLCELLIKVSLIIFVLFVLMIVYYFKFLQKKENEINDLYLQVQKVSITDALTNLYNKRHYLNNAPIQLNNCIRYSGYISFILLDVDKFKKYNDFYGHLKGDDVLKEIADTMQKNFKRTSDCAYRVGGEEFLIINTSIDENNAYEMAEILRLAILDLKIEHKQNQEQFVTISIGVCTQKADNTVNINNLYDNADKALYHSKNNGRNQVTLFDNIT